MTPGPEDIDLEASTVWIIKGGESHKQVAEFLDDEIIGVPFPDIPDAETLERSKVLRLLGATLDNTTSAQEQQANQFLSFARRMKLGDVVMMIDPQTKGFACGIVIGDYVYAEGVAPGRCRHRRAVEWRRRLPFDALPERLDHLPKQRAVLDDVPEGRVKALLRRAFLHEIGEDPFDRPVRAKVKKASTPRRRTSVTGGKVVKPPAKEVPMRRCVFCMMNKQLAFFDGDSQACRDCE